MKAEALLDRFAVYGRYYQAMIAGVDESLRDRLEICPKGWDASGLAQREPDLLVVMMNPGASRPRDAVACDARVGLVAAVPDRTQYQIMRVLLAAQEADRGWRHARVVNLSDLRTPKSAELLQKLERCAEDDRHSLFGAHRSAECRAVFGNGATPVLQAWGLSPALVPWAQRALRAAQGHPRLGISADGVSFRHPLPQRQDLQLLWLAQIKAQLATAESP